MEFTVRETTAPTLSHVEAVYHPGERDLAIELFETLGCTVYDTGVKSPAGSTYVSVHPDTNDRGHDNVLYLSQMPAAQHALEKVLIRKIDEDAELSAARADYRQMAADQPFGLSHLAVRYPTFEDLEQVLSRAEENMSQELKSRILLKVFRPGDSVEIGDDSLQAFIYTDIAVAGVSAFGQVIELSSYR